MSKTDRDTALSLTRAHIEKRFGKGAIMFLGENKIYDATDVISTGSLALDIALGIGGLPMGRVAEIYGPEGSGKTTIALSVIANCQKRGGSVPQRYIHTTNPTSATISVGSA